MTSPTHKTMKKGTILVAHSRPWKMTDAKLGLVFPQTNSIATFDPHTIMVFASGPNLQVYVGLELEVLSKDGSTYNVRRLDDNTEHQTYFKGLKEAFDLKPTNTAMQPL